MCTIWFWITFFQGDLKAFNPHRQSFEAGEGMKRDSSVGTVVIAGAGGTSGQAGTEYRRKVVRKFTASNMSVRSVLFSVTKLPVQSVKGFISFLIFYCLRQGKGFVVL